MQKPVTSGMELCHPACPYLDHVAVISNRVNFCRAYRYNQENHILLKGNGLCPERCSECVMEFGDSVTRRQGNGQ